MKNNRTFLEKLLDGAEVKWIPLGDVADYEQPTKYLVNSTVYNDNYPIPVLTAGKTFILGYTNEDEGIYFASKSPVIIFDDFTTANKWVDFDFKAKSSAMKMITSKNEKFALLKYIYYWLNTLPNNQIDGDHKRQWISNYANKLIPIPPLSVQTKIVKILDALTALTSELTSELILRQKQYEYYREKLLSEEELGKVGFEWKCLKNIFNIFAGGDVPKEFYSQHKTQEFNIPILSNGTGNKSLYGWTNKAKINKPSLTISARGTIGWTSYREEPFYPIVRLLVLTPKIELNLKYAYHFMKMIEKTYKVPESGIPQLTKPMIEDLRIPVPSFSEQQSIASILDKFETLTHSITEGLPLAIEQSQKRYEYYRELLLSF